MSIVHSDESSLMMLTLAWLRPSLIGRYHSCEGVPYALLPCIVLHGIGIE